MLERFLPVLWEDWTVDRAQASACVQQSRHYTLCSQVESYGDEGSIGWLLNVSQEC